METGDKDLLFEKAKELLLSVDADMEEIDIRSEALAGLLEPLVVEYINSLMQLFITPGELTALVDASKENDLTVAETSLVFIRALEAKKEKKLEELITEFLDDIIVEIKKSKALMSKLAKKLLEKDMDNFVSNIEEYTQHIFERNLKKIT